MPKGKPDGGVLKADVVFGLRYSNTGAYIGQKEDFLWAMSGCCDAVLIYSADHMCWCCARCMVQYPMVDTITNSGHKIEPGRTGHMKAKQWISFVTAQHVDDIELTVTYG